MTPTRGPDFSQNAKRVVDKATAPHPNARRLLETRSVEEAVEARERSIEASKILDAGQAKDSSEFLLDRLSDEVRLRRD